MGWKNDTSREERRRIVAPRLFGSGERFWHLHRAHLPPFFLFSTQTSRHAHAIVTPAKNKAAPPVLGDEAVAFQAIGLRVPTGPLASLHYSCVLLHRAPAVPNLLAFFFVAVLNNKFAFVFAERRTSSNTVP